MNYFAHWRVLSHPKQRARDSTSKGAARQVVWRPNFSQRLAGFRSNRVAVVVDDQIGYERRASDRRSATPVNAGRTSER
jgi:hypothetical protein